MGSRGAAGALGGGGNGTSNGAQLPLLGNALGPVTKSIIEASAVLPMLKEVMKFADGEKLKAAFASVGEADVPVPPVPPGSAVPPPVMTRAGRVTTNG